MSLRLPLALAVALLSGCASSASFEDGTALRQEVMATERAFARTMAERDHAAFTSFLSEEAIFFSGEQTLRGKQQVAEAWKQYFEAEKAPFSWEPEEVEVLESGTLALSSGPVYDAEGKLVVRFTSIWRRGASGTWRIVFDNGNPACEEP